MKQPEKQAGVISSEDFEAGKGRWPCVKCGRNEAEACNGHGACPNGRTKASMLRDRWPASHEACKVDVERFNAMMREPTKSEAARAQERAGM